MRTGVANPARPKDIAPLQGEIDVALHDVAVHEQCPRAALRPGRVFDRIVHSDMKVRIRIRASQLLNPRRNEDRRRTVITLRQRGCS